MAHQHKGFEADNCPRCGTAQRRMGQMDSVPDRAVPERAGKFKNPHPRTLGSPGDPPTPWEVAEMAEDDRRNPRDSVAEHAENARMFRGEVTPPKRRVSYARKPGAEERMPDGRARIQGAGRGYEMVTHGPAITESRAPSMAGMPVGEALDAHIAFHGAQHLEGQIYDHVTDGTPAVDPHAHKVATSFIKHYADDNG